VTTEILLREIVATMGSHHQAQLTLCMELEGIADSLPDELDTRKCLITAKAIYPVVRLAHEFEEAEVFPLLLNISGRDAELAASIERLRFEHWEDQSFAQELNDVLYCQATDSASCNAETTGYMLRGFFEGLRRHIAFEREHIGPRLMEHWQERFPESLPQ